MKLTTHLEVKKLRNRANQLYLAMRYRQVTQTELSKNIVGLSQPKLSRFLKGFQKLDDVILADCMEYLNFPFGFLDITIHNVAI
jgi:hypothetical protein